MKNTWKAAIAALSIFLLAGCKAWDCGCPMSESPLERLMDGETRRLGEGEKGRPGDLANGVDRGREALMSNSLPASRRLKL